MINELLKEQYETKILPKMKEFEPIQKKERKNFFKTLFLGIILISIATYATYYILFILKTIFISDISLQISIITVLPLFLLYLLYNSLKKTYDNFTNKLKKEHLPEILKNFDIIQFKTGINGTNIINNDELSKSGMFLFSETEADDRFEGVYKNVHYRVLEARLTANSGKDKETVFKGVIISFDFNKQFKNKTIIATKKDNIKNDIGTFIILIALIVALLILYIPITLLFGLNCLFLIACFIVLSVVIVKIKDIKTSKEKEPNAVSLEDPVFNKKYDVYAEDQVEARYLITTSFMERLNNLKTAFETIKLKCSFFDGKLMFAISTNKNLFEIGNLFTKLTNPKTIETFYNQLNSIYEMIDYFKLNEKTGL